MTETQGTFRRPVRTALAFGIAFAVVIGLFASWSARSDAAVICVSADPGAECQATYNGVGAVQAAFFLASITFETNEIRISPGTYTGNLSYNETLHEDPLTVVGVGSGPEDVNLVMGNSIGAATGLRLHTVPGSVIRNLTYTIPANADGDSDVALDLKNVTADEIAVNGPTATNVAAIRCQDCNVTDTTIDLPTEDGTMGVDQYSGAAHVADSTIRADYGVRHSSPGITTTVERSRIKARTGAIADGGHFDISNTLFQLDDRNGAIGIDLHNANAGSMPITADLDSLTIINGAGANTKGIRAWADNGTETVDATLTNSVISGFNFAAEDGAGRTLSLKSGPAAENTVKFHTDYSAFEGGAAEILDGANEVDYVNDHHNDLAGGVSFADPGSGDFTPSLLGDLRDSGSPADPGPGETDILGSPRACHSGDDGVIRRDIGAFEFRLEVSGELDDCIYPDTSIVDGPEAYPPAMYTSETMTFVLASTKPGAAFKCSIDGGPETDCGTSFTSEVLSRGLHTFRAKAVDQFGNIDQSPVELDFYMTDPKEPPPTCETDPSLCPVVDKTKPKVIGLKYAKKTKLKRVRVRFKSNEKGSTFTCKLNGAKAKKCKSPWKTPKLRKGKNTIRIQATDKAGNRSRVVKRVIRRK